MACSECAGTHYTLMCLNARTDALGVMIWRHGHEVFRGFRAPCFVYMGEIERATKYRGVMGSCRRTRHHKAGMHEPCHGGIARFSRKGSSGCRTGHIVDRHRFYMKMTGNDVDSREGRCLQTPGDLGCIVTSMYLGSYEKKSQEPESATLP